MADNSNIHGDADRQRINVNQEHEVRHWSQKLCVTPEKLRQAVQHAGPIASDVERHLRKHSGNGDWRRKSVG